MPLPFERRRRQTAAKLAALMLANAFIFQEQLSSVEGQVKTIRYYLARQYFVNEIVEHWTMIIDTINYIPIFKVARDILLERLMPLLPVRSTSCRRAVGGGRRCRVGSGRRHVGCGGG
jgi:hypothetical protein